MTSGARLLSGVGVGLPCKVARLGHSPQVRAQPRGPSLSQVGGGGRGLPEDKLGPRVVDASGGEP